ncbi:MAG TPA: DUF882 domain-containing protein [Polyangia bacterium]|nr:DUF882 domain-containing protein [Polyangia bacterium]
MLRRTALGAAFALLIAFAPRAHAEADDEAAEAASSEAPAAAAEADDAPVAKPARAHHRRHKRGRHGRFVGHVVPEDQLRVDPLPRPSGNLAMVSINNPNEPPVKVNIYNPDGSYNLDALEQLNHILRCRRTDTEKAMDPQLLTLLSHVYDHFGGKPLEIVSGYRNQRKQTSNHFKGRASDIRIAGITPKKIEAFAETLDRGGMGIGIYPRSKFVHIDVRSPPSYRWIDYSPPNSNAAEKRPPRGWKRKKLES